MALQATGLPIAVVLDPDLESALKSVIRNGIDTGFERATPIALAVTQRGVDSSIMRSTNTCGEKFKEKVTPYVSQNNLPSAHATIDSSTTILATGLKTATVPLVESCVRSTSTVAQESMHKATNDTVDTISLCFKNVSI
jgi:hypothetical protein